MPSDTAKIQRTTKSLEERQVLALEQIADHLERVSGELFQIRGMLQVGQKTNPLGR